MKDSLWLSKTQVETSSRVLSSQLLSMAVKAQPVSLAEVCVLAQVLSWPTFRGMLGPPQAKDSGLWPHRRRSVQWGGAGSGGLPWTGPVQMLLSGPALAASVSWRIICFTLCLSWIERILSFPLLLCLFPVLFLKFCVCFSFYYSWWNYLVFLSVLLFFFSQRSACGFIILLLFYFNYSMFTFSNSFLLVFFCFKICFLAYHIKNQLYVYLFSPKYRYF